jgi:hypothetical protein
MEVLVMSLIEKSFVLNTNIRLAVFIISTLLYYLFLILFCYLVAVVTSGTRNYVCVLLL